MFLQQFSIVSACIIISFLAYLSLLVSKIFHQVIEIDELALNGMY
jgi:hypothetical protein